MSNVTPFERTDPRPDVSPADNGFAPQYSPDPVEVRQPAEGKEHKLALFFDVQLLWRRRKVDTEYVSLPKLQESGADDLTSLPTYMDSGPGFRVEGGILVSTKP